MARHGFTQAEDGGLVDGVGESPPKDQEETSKLKAAGFHLVAARLPHAELLSDGTKPLLGHFVITPNYGEGRAI
jgi:hypothetical protein